MAKATDLNFMLSCIRPYSRVKASTPAQVIATLLVGGRAIRLNPGMAVASEMQTGNRKVIEFLVPLLWYKKKIYVRDSEKIMTVNEKTYSILRVLDYTKINKKWFDGKGLIAGYHSVNIQGEHFKGQRDPEIRLKKIDYDFTGKRVFDVGCSNGGLLHSLAPVIDVGVGIDFNSKCINAANVLKAVNKVENIHFYSFDLDKEDLLLLNHLLLGEKVDICLFLNISLWVKRWKDVFRLCSVITDAMLFEAHGSDDQQAEQYSFICSTYTNVWLLSEKSDDDPTYTKRKTYYCENKIESVIREGVSDNEFF